VNDPDSLARRGSPPGLDEADFDALYLDCAAAVYNYVRYRCGDDEAEDVTADVFVRAWRCRGQYQPALGAPSAWLWAIARNMVKNHLRDRPALTELLDAADALSAGGGDRDAGAWAHFAWGEAMAALGRLAPVDQEIIALRFGAGHTNRAIAGMLDLSENTVAQRLHRALHRLRADLEKSGTYA